MDDDGVFLFQVAGLRPAWQYEDLIWYDSSASLQPCWYLTIVHVVGVCSCISTFSLVPMPRALSVGSSSRLKPLGSRSRTLMFLVFIILLPSIAGTRTGSRTRMPSLRRTVTGMSPQFDATLWGALGLTGSIGGTGFGIFVFVSCQCRLLSRSQPSRAQTRPGDLPRKWHLQKSVFSSRLYDFRADFL